MNHLDWCTHIQFKEDQDILTRKNFDVNIRLLKSNDHYKNIIKSISAYILTSAQTKKDGYKEPLGWSGANAGIPFNIIATKYQIYINPVIMGKWGEIIVNTNCGSLTLEKSIPVMRYKSINLRYYDIYGNIHIERGIGPNPGFTIQHEIAHTQGKLINE